MIDEIAWRYYGAVDDATLRAVLSANPGIAGIGATLPAGVLIELPDIAPAPSIAAEVSLWS